MPLKSHIRSLSHMNMTQAETPISCGFTSLSESFYCPRAIFSEVRRLQRGCAVWKGSPISLPRSSTPDSSVPPGLPMNSFPFPAGFLCSPDHGMAPHYLFECTPKVKLLGLLSGHMAILDRINGFGKL